MEGTEKLYSVKEIFYSLQGEGYYTGCPAVFVRFCGCNLRCPFCDTDFANGERMTLEEIVESIHAEGKGCHFVVFTGGEPTLQLDEALISALHRRHYFLAMETNGTRPYPSGIDWVTISPKNDFCRDSILEPTNPLASEVKVVYTGENRPEKYGDLGRYKYLQPCDTGDEGLNREIIAKSVGWLKAHPDWRLSLQTQKIINVR